MASPTLKSSSPPASPTAASPDRISICNDLIAYAPPGELDHVLHDLEILLGDQSKHAPFKSAVYKALALYNMTQFTRIPSQSKTILCPPAHVKDDLFMDPRTSKSFTVDHATCAVSNEAEYAVPENEQTRVQLQALVDTYVHQYYHEGVGSVFYKDTAVHVVHVSSKFNPGNFWNGQWKAHWVWDLEKQKLTGEVQANIHFFEDGNIQLHFDNLVVTEMPADSTPDSVVKAIRNAENQRHKAVNDTYQKMNDNVFRNLRRALPLTKSKVDWNKMANYKIAAELTK